MNNTILLLAVDQLRGKNFSIGNYQRGYKWGKKEILELLNDIHCYNESNGIYCLQPIILQPIGNETEEILNEGKTHNISYNNEVIDGQQRTTTIYLILKYLNYLGLINKSYLFSINYQTRTRSGIFLNNCLEDVFRVDVESILDKELVEKKYNDLNAVNKLWGTFIENHQDYDNVDVYHFFTVSCYIKKWFETNLKSTDDKNEFINQFLTIVKVIWYSLDDAKDNQNVIDVFLNNNKGKIKLTTSELIKALFILNIKNTEIQTLADLKINQFALEWDSIEKKMQDDNFWYFIQSKSDLYQDGTRIDYLFDLFIKKSINDDEYYAYRHYELLFNANSNLSIEWESIVQLYTKLVDWYNDNLLYHYIGFITISGIKNLSLLLIDSIGKNKEELKTDLVDLIKKEFLKVDKKEEQKPFIYYIENLNYKKYPSQTKKVLFLHNVMYYVNNMAKHKFPFELFIKEEWSIEHIIPQNPKNIEEIDVYVNWYTELLNYNEDNSYSKIVEQLKQYDSVEAITKDRAFKSVLDKIAEEFENTTHKIDNLLLLDKNTNSALSNDLYKNKRIKILRFDKNGKNDKGEPVFIPIETLNAFNKTFGEKINIDTWSREDGEKYKEAIGKRLSVFLPQSNQKNYDII